MSFEEMIREHVLGDGVLRFAPRRPFKDFSPRSLADAIALIVQWPEKRGVLTHVVRAHIGHVSEAVASHVTIEAHFDCTAVPAALADRLIEIGFEPDGFVMFVPEHFSSHYTLKFKIDRSSTQRISELRQEVVKRCVVLNDKIQRTWPGLEYYIELEIYSDRARRRWESSVLRSAWQSALPFPRGALNSVLPPCTDEEALRLELPLSLTKQADVHFKISGATAGPERTALLSALVEVGFYRVLTWSGNDVCTAQFARVRDARTTFKRLEKFFDSFGGCVELTLEPVAHVWRSRQDCAGNRRLGALPPLVLSISEFDSCLNERLPLL